MAELNNNGSMTARFNGKTISIGMYNGKQVFGGAINTDKTLSGNITDLVTNGSVTSSYSVSGAAGDTGTFDVTVTPISGYELKTCGISVFGLGSNITAPASWTKSGGSCVGTFSYTIPASNTTDNFSVSATATLITYSGSINYSVASNVAPNIYPTSYTNRVAGTTINYIGSIDANSGFEFSGGATSLFKSGSVTVPSNGGDITVNFTSDTVTAAVVNVSGDITYTLPDNVTGSPSPSSYSNKAPNSSVSYFGTLSAASGYEFSGGGSTKFINGSFNVGSGGDKTVNLNVSANQVSAINRKVTYSANNNSGGTISLSANSVTAGIGAKRTMTVTMDAGIGKYWSSVPTISGLAYSTASASLGSNPEFTGFPSDYFNRYTITLTTTIPNSNVTETFYVAGATSATPDTLWTSSNPSVGEASGSVTLNYLSTDPEGEPPNVLSSGSFITFTNQTFNNGVGSVVANYQANGGAQRTSTITLESSIDSSNTDTLTLTQAAASVVIATGATWSNVTSKASPFQLDGIQAGSQQFNFSTTPINGLVAITTDNLNSNVTVNLDNSNNRITVSWPSLTTDDFSVVLHPQGDVNTDLDTLFLSIQEEQ